MTYEYMTGMGKNPLSPEDSENLDISSIVNMFASSPGSRADSHFEHWQGQLPQPVSLPSPSCDQQTCPPFNIKTRHDFSYVGAGASRATNGRRAAFQARGCTKLPPCGPREITGGGTEYYCCPQGGSGVFNEPVSLPPQPGLVTPQQVVPPQPVPALGPEARSFLNRIPPWQLIVGTGLIVGGIAWFVKVRT